MRWIADSIVDHAINRGSSYIKLPKELNHPKKVCLVFKILIIISTLNSVLPDFYMMPIVIQQELERLTKI